MASAPRRRNPGQRRRVEDGDGSRANTIDLDDDSATDASPMSSNRTPIMPSDAVNVGEGSTMTTNSPSSQNGNAKRSDKASNSRKSPADATARMDALSLEEKQPSQATDQSSKPSTFKSPAAPVVVSSSSAAKNPPNQQTDHHRQNEEGVDDSREQDPSFVPNRGSFFMHDQRNIDHHPGGYRPYGGGGRGRGGRANYNTSFGHMRLVRRTNAPGLCTDANCVFSHPYQHVDPTMTGQWAHDMHETEPFYRRPRQTAQSEGPPNGNGYIPTCKDSESPINRILSVEKQLGKAQVRVFLPELNVEKVFPSIVVKQYTKLPDHRPPLRRDKPVRISLPGRQPRYIFPASDRSFTFIPRALRPNQQRGRGRPRSNWGSVGGYSRRTSIYGGSFYGSMYSPSVDLSRRSSVVYDQTPLFSPTGSVMSRQLMPMDPSHPVVRLPPADMPLSYEQQMMPPPPVLHHPPGSMLPPPVPVQDGQAQQAATANASHAENQASSLPMHQPRPKKNISVADIETPALDQGNPSFQQAFHQQVPFQVDNGLQSRHGRHASQVSHASRSSQRHGSDTPLSQLPDHSVHATPFQPIYGPTSYYSHQPHQGQQGYYYPPSYGHPGMGGGGLYAAHGRHGSSSSNQLVAQEVNGMMYYYDPTQIPAGGSYPSYSNQVYQPAPMGMQSMMTPSPDTFYYAQQAPNMMYYAQ